MIRRDLKPTEPYPTMTIIEDVCRREGPPGIDDYTPFNGCEHILLKQFGGSQIHNLSYKLFFGPDMLLKDYDPNVSRGSKPSDHLKFLEELGESPSSLEDFVRDTCVGYKMCNYGLGPTLRYAKPVPVTYDDDGEMSLMSDLTEEEPSLPEETSEVDDIKRLIFVIKNIHYESCNYTKIQLNMFSFIKEYYMLKEEIGENSINVHRIGMLIKVGRMFRFASDDLNSFKMTTEHDWSYFQKCDEWTIFINEFLKRKGRLYALAAEYYEIMNALGFKIKDENPLAYNNSFISSLPCTYLPTNDEYLRNVLGVRNKIIDDGSRIVDYYDWAMEEDVDFKLRYSEFVSTALSNNPRVLPEEYNFDTALSGYFTYLGLSSDTINALKSYFGTSKGFITFKYNGKSEYFDFNLKKESFTYVPDRLIEVLSNNYKSTLMFQEMSIFSVLSL